MSTGQRLVFVLIIVIAVVIATPVMYGQLRLWWFRRQQRRAR